MKNFVLFLAAFLVLNLSSFAQNNVQFNIYHKLGDIDFAFNTAAKNNLDHDFNVSRLQYYISEISIVHDGGMETAIDDFWILANASEVTQADLGNHNINEVEGINFHLGVDPDHNHLDPSKYNGSHPLAPQFPSMHWGWQAGYRFLAYEGKSGSNLNQLFQLHGLGDDNYFRAEIALSTAAANNEIVINLDADYIRGLENIALINGVIVHGDFGAAKQALENFRDYVFTPSSITSATIDFSEVNSFDVFPNPTSDGSATLFISASENLTYEVSVSDILGRQIQHHDAVNSNTSMELKVDQPGVYFINLIKEGQPVITKKLISRI